jgi:lipopolysaccharide export system protein LptA
MNRFASHVFAVTLVIAALCVSAAASAERADRKLKVNVSSLDSEGDYGKGIYRLSRNVVITQGTLKITADRADIRTDETEQYHAVLTAKPVCFRQRTDNGDWAQGVADRVEYNSGQGVVELFGNALLIVGEDETRANYIVYNTQNGTFESRDSKDRKSTGGGVNFVLQPREKDEKPAAVAGAMPATPVAVAPKPPIVKTANPPKRNEPAFSRCA